MRLVMLLWSFQLAVSLSTNGCRVTARTRRVASPRLVCRVESVGDWSRVAQDALRPMHSALSVRSPREAVVLARAWGLAPQAAAVALPPPVPVKSIAAAKAEARIGKGLALVRLLTPLSCAYTFALACLGSIGTGASGAAVLSAVPLPIAVWCIAEAAFCAFRCVELAGLQRRGTPPPTLSSPDTRALELSRALSTVKGKEAEWVEGWFYGRSYRTLRREEVKQWLAGNMFASDASELSTAEAAELEGMVSRVERAIAAPGPFAGLEALVNFNFKFPEGRNAAAAATALVAEAEAAAAAPPTPASLLESFNDGAAALTDEMMDGAAALRDEVLDGAAALRTGVDAAAASPDPAGYVSAAAAHAVDEAGAAASRAAAAAVAAAPALVPTDHPIASRVADDADKMGPINHSVDPVKARVNNPLLLYAALAAIKSSNSVALAIDGFTRHSTASAGLNYWHRPPTDPDAAAAADDAAPPVVFVHGIGIGLQPYKAVIDGIGDMCPESDYYLVEIPAISMSVGATAPTASETAQVMAAMLGGRKATLIGHSFGTVAIAHVLKMAPHCVRSAVLVDPVAFLINLAKTTRNFLYDGACADPVADLLQTDHSIAHFLHRQFWWNEAMLTPEDLCVPTSVVLSAADHVVPSPDVARLLKEARKKGNANVDAVVTLEGGEHGSFLFEATQRQAFFAQVERRIQEDKVEFATEPRHERDAAVAEAEPEPAAPHTPVQGTMGSLYASLTVMAASTWRAGAAGFEA